MEETYFLVSSITYAMKGQELLKNKGYKAYIVRDMEKNEHGCGYAIFVKGDRRAAAAALEKGRVKVAEVREGSE